jgi:hypothetical protein
MLLSANPMQQLDQSGACKGRRQLTKHFKAITGWCFEWRAVRPTKKPPAEGNGFFV